MSTIHRLARRGDVEGLRAALGESPDPRALANEVDDAGWTPLYYAAAGETPSVEAARTLLEVGADPGYVRVEVRPGMSEEDQARMREMMGEAFDASEPFFSSKDSEFRESLLSGAIKAGGLDVVRLLREHGADLTYVDGNGYNAILDAVYGTEERPDLLRDLLDLGADPNVETTYGETAVAVAYRLARWRLLAVLLDAGTDPAPLAWTPLHRAVAFGTEAETLAALAALAAPDDLRAYDCWRRTPLHLALYRGDAPRAAFLVAHGADPSQPAEDGASPLAVAAEGGHTEAVALVLGWGRSPKAEIDAALHVAVEYGHHAAARALLEAGGDPEWQGEEIYPTLEQANDPEMVRLLLDYGADPSSLKAEGRRLLLGLPERDPSALDGVTREEYLAARHPREGTTNPESLTDPFRLAMIRAGTNAYRARRAFDDEATFACGIGDGEGGEREPPVWCFDRFGVSTTILSDGRIVLVAGEHEDYYDPDFCIYNDVAVFAPGGGIALYGYPYAIFPPTDHHSATLVGEWIYLVGNLGYAGTRGGPIPVARLSVVDFAIEPLTTRGEVPGRIFDHRASLVGGDVLRIAGGTAITFADGEESHDPNPHAYDLDLRTLIWTRAVPDPTPND